MGSMQDQFWGDRCGTFKDPEGHTWTIATRKEDLTREEMDQRQAEWMKNFTAAGSSECGGCRPGRLQTSEAIEALPARTGEAVPSAHPRRVISQTWL